MSKEVVTEVKVKLSSPITVNDSKVSEITVKEPNGGALIRHGLPFSSDGVRMDVAANLLESATGIQLPFIKTLGGRDLMKLVNALVEVLSVDEEGFSS